MKPRFPQRTYTSVASTSINAESNPKGDAQNRLNDEGDSVIDSPASKEACQIFPHLFVITPRQTPGRRSDKPPLIINGYTGRKFSTGETMWDLKKKNTGLGVTVSGNIDPSLNDVETHTVDTSGLVTALATRQYAVGDRLTWLPVEINSDDYANEVSNLRRAAAHLTGGKCVPVDLRPITPELELRTLDPAISAFLKAVSESNTTAEFRTNLSRLERGSPIELLAYNLFAQPIQVLFKSLGNPIDAVDAILVHNCGIIGLRLQNGKAKAKSLAVDKVAVEKAYSKENIDNSWDSFANMNVALSEAKMAVRPIGVAETSANAGQLFQLNLGKH